MAEVGHKPSIQECFDEFHANNPHVYERLLEMAFEAKIAGLKKIGIKLLFEVIRWEHMKTISSDDFKLNNNFTSRYARLIITNEPVLKDFFETRELLTK